MSQLNNASLSELRIIAHALCEDARFKIAYALHLGRLNGLNPDGCQATTHIDLIERATAQELLEFHTSLCTSDSTKKRVDNYLQILRYKKPAELATEAAEPLDPISNATAKDPHRVMTSLCNTDEIMKRVATHLRMLHPTWPTPGTSARGVVNAATEAELHAIGLAMCEVDEDMKKRVLECLRVIAIFGQSHGTKRKHAAD